MWTRQCSENPVGAESSYILINGRDTIMDNKIRSSMRVRVVSIVTIWGWYLQTVSYYKQKTCIFIDADCILENFITELSRNLNNHSTESYIMSKGSFVLLCFWLWRIFNPKEHLTRISHGVCVSLLALSSAPQLCISLTDRRIFLWPICSEYHQGFLLYWNKQLFLHFQCP